SLFDQFHLAGGAGGDVDRLDEGPAAGKRGDGPAEGGRAGGVGPGRAGQLRGRVQPELESGARAAGNPDRSGVTGVGEADDPARRGAAGGQFDKARAFAADGETETAALTAEATVVVEVLNHDVGAAD